MPTNYIADFDSRPDMAYVKNQADILTAGALDYFDAEWEARVQVERIVDADLAELAEGRREQRKLASAATRDAVLIVLNRPAKRVTVKGLDRTDGKSSKTRYFESVEAAQAKVAELRKYFGGKGVAFRVWIPA